MPQFGEIREMQKLMRLVWKPLDWGLSFIDVTSMGAGQHVFRLFWFEAWLQLMAHGRLCNRWAPVAWLNILNMVCAGDSEFSSNFPMNQALRTVHAQSVPVHKMDQVPLNIHGSAKFMVKAQMCLTGSNVPHMIYDKDRSFLARMEPRVGAGFRHTADVIGTHGLHGLKIYLWAHRVAADKLRVYLDRRPSQSQYLVITLPSSLK